MSARTTPPRAVVRRTRRPKYVPMTPAAREAKILSMTARRQRERAEAHSRTKQALRELDTAIEVGDRSYRRLSHRLDDYGTRLGAARVKLHVDES